LPGLHARDLISAACLSVGRRLYTDFHNLHVPAPRRDESIRNMSPRRRRIAQKSEKRREKSHKFKKFFVAPAQSTPLTSLSFLKTGPYRIF
jgi:hypothetical protein